jgi:Raf kinase inhibitor-like protein, YbhB/YbcL family
MKITSSVFQEGGNIPSKFTCDGGDTSPPLQIAEVPSGAKSLALVVDDPDAPSGLFTHWMVWNISPQTNTIAEGSTPKGVHGTNDFGKSGYGGPCPPSGTHRYYFKIFCARSRARLTVWCQAESAGCGNKRARCCARGTDRSLLKEEMTVTASLCEARG